MNLAKALQTAVQVFLSGFTELERSEKQLDESIAQKKKEYADLSASAAGLEERISTHRNQLQAQTKFERETLDKQKADQAAKESALNARASELSMKEMEANSAKSAAERAKATYEEKARECDALKADLKAKADGLRAAVAGAV